MESGNFNLKPNDKIVIDFIGGSFEIKAEGQFVNNDNGQNVVYGPKVNLFKVMDKGGKILPSHFLALLDALKVHPHAMSVLKDLAKRE